MFKKTLISTAALAGFVALAFGSAGGSGDFDFDDFELELDIPTDSKNQDACKAYWTHYNSLSCAPSQEDVDMVCPDALNLLTCDQSSYYECLQGAATCNGDIPDFSEMPNCENPC